MRRLILPLLTLSALLISVGGALHFRDWARTYRAVPWEVPGAWVVRVGFPVNAASSILVAVGLVAAATRLRRFRGVTVATAIAFQGASLVALIVSRRGSVFGWTEPGWTTNTRQIAAVEIAALVALAAAGAECRRPNPRRVAVAAAPASNPVAATLARAPTRWIPRRRWRQG